MTGTRAEIYLDWNATTSLAPSVVEAMRAATEELWANPASVHAAGRRARAALEGASEQLAAFLGLHPRDVLFTSGGTEANNLALHGVVALATSRIEHPSVVRVAEALEAAGHPVAWLDVDSLGRVELEALRAALGRLPRGATTAVAAANHETGVVQPIAAIADVVQEFEGRLHVDIVQTVGKMTSAHWARADSVSLSAHKIRGPKGLGVLAWRPPWVPRPLLLGGAQQRGLRPGTLDAVACVGLEAALLRQATVDYGRLAPLRDRLEQALAGVAQINGGGARLPHVTNLSFHAWRGDELVAALDLNGVRVSSGSACSAGTAEPSTVITAFAGSARAQSAVRFSLGELTTEDDIEHVIRLLRDELLTRR